MKATDSIPQKSYLAQDNMPVSTGIKLDDVSKNVLQYIWHRKLKELILITIPVIAWEIFLILVLIHASNAPPQQTDPTNTGGVFGMMSLPLGLYAAWLARITQKFQRNFLAEFAAANGYTYDQYGMIDEAYGTIFRLSSNSSASDVITGSFKGYPIRMFRFSISYHSDKYSQDLTDTVIEIDLKGKLPRLLMVNKKSQVGQIDIEGVYVTKNQFSLEGDFNQHFKLFGLPGTQIEALEVFSPDIMQLMESEASNFTVEFVYDRVYLYSPGVINRTQQLTDAFTLAEHLIQKIGPLAERLANDSSIEIPAAYTPTVNKPGFFSVGWLGWTQVLLSIGVLVVAVIGVFTNKSSLDYSYSNSSTIVSRANVKGAHDLSAAENVSDAFISDLQAGKVDDAYNLESTGLRAHRSDQGILSRPQDFVPPQSSVKIDTWIGVNLGYAEAGIEYYFPGSNYQAPYLKLQLVDQAGQWRVFSYQTTPAAISPAPLDKQ